MSDTARRAAFDAFDSVMRQGTYVHLAAKEYFADLEDLDRRFAGELLLGTLDKLITVDYFLDRFIRKRVHGKVRNVLRLGAYQIIFMDRVPDHAACTTSVQLVRQIGKPDSAGFVNAVMRNLSRAKTEIAYPDPKKDALLYRSVRYSLPPWLIELWQQQMGDEATNALLTYESPNETVIRGNEFRGMTHKKLLAFLKDNNIDYHCGRLLDTAIHVKAAAGIFNSTVFAAGEIVVQGESSQLLGKIVADLEPHTLWDCCSAPGGKTAVISQYLRGTCHILASDVHAHRVDLISSLIKRQNLPEDMITVMEHDAAAPLDKMTFDVVLVDAPCSALGTIFSHPDVKMRQNLDSIREISSIQAKILRNTCRNVNVGGYLVYSTCTMTKQENDQNITKFLEDHDTFRLIDLAQRYPNLGTKEPTLQLQPYQYDTDGFFIAIMERVK